MNNTLVHYGVLGMKWGVRRYQNTDGTLTAAGKKHYGSSGNKKLVSVSKDRFVTNADRRLSDMTDADIEKAVRRLQLEKQYKELSSKDISKGNDWVDDLIVSAGTAAITSLVMTLASKGGASAGTTLLKAVVDSAVFKAVFLKK